MGGRGGLRAAVGLSLITALVLLGAAGGPPLRLGGVPVTLGAAGLIGLGYYLAQSAWLAGLAYWTLYRPLVAGLVVGLVLGDPWTGARIGATLNIAFLGFLGTGGALPTDMALVGYVGATVALATGLSAPASLALALPFGLLGYGLYRIRLRWSNASARRAVRYARQGDVRGIALCNVLVPQVMLLLLAWVPGVAAAYLAPPAAGWLAATVPGWVIDGLDLTGALLVALGAAAGLALVWTRRTAACYLGAAVVTIIAMGPETALLVGLLGAAGAMAFPWLGQERRREGENAAGRQNPAPGPGSNAWREGPVRGRDRLASLLTWLFFSHAGYSEERRQAMGLAQAMAPVLRRLYSARLELGRALVRYLAPFNVEPNLGSAVVGVLGHQEEALARGQAAPSAPEETRARLAGPVSGVGDAVIHGAVGTVAIALGVAVATVAGPVGAIAYSGLAAVVVWGVSAWAFREGYRGGVPRVLDLLRGAAWRRLVVGAECAGAILVGLLTAGPVAGLLGPPTLGTGATVTVAAGSSSQAEGLAMIAGGIASGSLAVRALESLPAVALVLTFLVLQRWGLRRPWVVAACYGVGLAMALLRLA